MSFAPCTVTQLHNTNQQNAHFYINVLILIFLCLLQVSNPMIYLQEDSCMYSYGTVRFTCISISSLAGSRLLIRKTHYTILEYTTVFLKLNLWFRNM